MRPDTVSRVWGPLSDTVDSARRYTTVRERELFLTKSSQPLPLGLLRPSPYAHLLATVDLLRQPSIFSAHCLYTSSAGLAVTLPSMYLSSPA